MNDNLFPGKSFWMREYWDRFICDMEHLNNNIVKYIHNNPVKAGLCETVEEWKWSSAALNFNSKLQPQETQFQI